MTSKKELYNSTIFFEYVFEPYSRKIEIKHSNILWLILIDYIKHILTDFLSKDEKGKYNYNGPLQYCDICLEDCYGISIADSFSSCYQDERKFLNLLNELVEDKHNFEFCKKKINQQIFISPFFTMCILCLSRELLITTENTILDASKVDYPTRKPLFVGGPNLVCKKCYDLVNEIYGGKDRRKKILSKLQKEKELEKKEMLEKQINNIPPILSFLRDISAYSMKEINNTKSIFRGLLFSIELDYKNKIATEKEDLNISYNTEGNNSLDEDNFGSNEEEKILENIKIKKEGLIR